MRRFEVATQENLDKPFQIYPRELSVNDASGCYNNYPVGLGRAGERTQSLAMPNRLRVGIIGLGGNWRRWRHALTSLRNIVEPVAIYDPRPGRATRAARELRCSQADGAIPLLEQDDVDAVLLLDAPWYGLWPLEQACRVGKPVFCAVSPIRDDANADQLLQAIHGAGLPVMFALPGAVAPARILLDKVLSESAGPVRLIRAERGILVSDRHAPTGTDLLACTPLLDLLVGVEAILRSPPLFVTASSVGHNLLDIQIMANAAQHVQISLWTTTVRPVSTRIEVVAENGVATSTGSCRVSWRQHSNRTVYVQEPRNSAQSLLERFVVGLRARTPLWPGCDEAHGALRVVRAAARSLVESRNYTLNDGINLSKMGGT